VVLDCGATLGSGDGGFVSSEKRTLGDVAGSGGDGRLAKLGGGDSCSVGVGVGSGVGAGGVGLLALEKMAASCCRAVC